MPSPVWKPGEAAPPPGTGRAWQVVLVAGLLLALGGAALAWLLFPDPFTRPRFLPLGVYEYPTSIPARPWARQDIEALEGLAWVKSSTAHNSQQARLLKAELEGLASASPDQPVVIYLGGYVAERDGKACLLPADARLDQPSNWLPLADVLSLLRLCPARRKLLLFDALRPLSLPERGFVRSDIAARAWPLLEECAKEDAALAILTSCSPGQASRASAVLGNSVFARFVLKGLDGAADGWPKARPDGRVKLHELAAYVRDAVGHWSMGEGNRQTPVLLGGKADWPIALVPSEPGEESSGLGDLPNWLAGGWGKLDGWYGRGLTKATAPVYAALGKALLDAEGRWRGGVEPGRVRADLEARMAKLEEEYRPVAPKAFPPEEPAPPEAEVEELRRLLVKRDRLPPKPTDDMLKPILGGFEALAKKHMGRSAALASLVVAAASTQPLSAEGAKLLAGLDPAMSDHSAEVRLLARLAARGAEKPALWSPEAARLLVLSLGEVNRVERFVPEALAWGKESAFRAANLRTRGEEWAFGSAVPWERGMPEVLRSSLSAARSAQQARAVAQAAIQARDEAMGLLPGYLLSDQLDAGEVASLGRAAAAALRLNRLLADGASGTVELEDATRAIRQGPDSLQSFLRPLRSEPFRALIGRMKDDRPADIRLCRLLLSTAWPTARQRSALWSALREGSRRRSEKSMEPLGPPGSARPPLPEIPAWDERAAQQGGTKLRERDLFRASATVLRLRLTTGADLAEADSLLGKLRRDPSDAASWQKLAAALRRAGG